MKSVEIRKTQDEDFDFLESCGHEIGGEIEDSVLRRRRWFRRKWKEVLISLVGYVDNDRAGLLSVFPIEVSPWGPLGRDLYVIACLFVLWDYQKKGLGTMMMFRAIEIAKHSRKEGVVSFGYSDPDWFLPESFFEKFGLR
ncbi:MAG: GNAT family N-acetyltransferase [Kosmotogaceae bacterium]|nr:GNAT family N-acetyltransferase [Kosmotogaceae bacterium]